MTRSSSIPPGRGQPPLGRGQTPIGRGQPPLGRGQPPIGRGQPPLGRGQPPLGRDCSTIPVGWAVSDGWAFSDDYTFGLRMEEHSSSSSHWYAYICRIRSSHAFCPTSIHSR
ncbi:hypothetical protein R1sor_002855 [Riccia sorocarpa]|uniref:Uncharacterized protein n=1 Tax=Riccia sorocarpa TaxID=122646 RepID=A0ABD3H0S7_9MARC